jgi:hypothetical protein
VGAVNGWMAKHRGITLDAIRRLHEAAAETDKTAPKAAAREGQQA